jgi:hypothetical protein
MTIVSPICTPIPCTRIDNLTDEQKAAMPAWRDKWIAIGLKTGAADRPLFDRAVKECYRFAKLEQPEVVWTTSPLTVVLTGNIAAYVLSKPRESVARKAADMACEQVLELAVPDAATRDAVRAEIRHATSEALAKCAPAEPKNGSKKSQKPNQEPTEAEVRSVLDSMRKMLWARFGGQLWPAWTAWSSFYREVCGLQLPDDLDDRARAYEDTVKSASWWFPHKQFVVVAERPTWIDLDPAGRLHSEARSAIAWPDGWGVYCWHGMRVPSDIIFEPEAITIERIEGENNAEIRRVLVERYGAERYLRETGAKEIHRDSFGVLLQKDQPNDEPILMVDVLNSTPEPDGSRKRYMLPVHPELRPLLGENPDGSPVLGEPQKLTAKNAVASTFGLRGEEYDPSCET